jgi:hypothetical protein
MIGTVAATAMLASCAGGSDDAQPRGALTMSPTSTASTVSTTGPIEVLLRGRARGPSDLQFTIHADNRVARLSPSTYCYGGTCVDGVGAIAADVGRAREVVIDFPLPDWKLSAIFTPAGERCGRAQTVPLVARGDGSHALRPAGHRGTYNVSLWAVGNGDASTAIRWTTPADGPRPEPESTLAILAAHDGRVDSYGVEFAVTNLARTPKNATATVTVTAANGEHLTFDATRTTTACLNEGSVLFDGPDERGLAAAALGPAPFTYDAVLVLNGVRHVAHATWPDDVIAGNEPSVALRFSPPLPALQ